MKHIYFLQSQKGFAMLFTVLVVSLILSIALGISNLTFKQTILSNLAKDSQISFYEADAAAECAIYYDITGGVFADTSDPNLYGTLMCGNDTFTIDSARSSANYLVFAQTSGSSGGPCASFSVDKRSLPQTIIQSRGYNICGESPRKVERALEVKY